MFKDGIPNCDVPNPHFDSYILPCIICTLTYLFGINELNKLYTYNSPMHVNHKILLSEFRFAN